MKYRIWRRDPLGSLREREDRRREIFKVSSNLRHKARNVQVVYPESLDIGQCGKLVKGTGVEQLLGKPNTGGPALANPEYLDQGKQTELVPV